MHLTVKKKKEKKKRKGLSEKGVGG